PRIGRHDPQPRLGLLVKRVRLGGVNGACRKNPLMRLRSLKRQLGFLHPVTNGAHAVYPRRYKTIKQRWDVILARRQVSVGINHSINALCRNWSWTWLLLRHATEYKSHPAGWLIRGELPLI